jgi:hypothetical protein
MKALFKSVIPSLIMLLVLNNDLSAQDKSQIKKQTMDQSQNEIHLKAQIRTENKITKGFEDLNGDGINDNAVDSDGDGIPNGKDPDYKKPLDGSGNKYMNGNGNQKRTGKGGFGPGDGTGTGVGPKDGTGFGSGSGTGTGQCDGTGPKGRGGKK